MLYKPFHGTLDENFMTLMFDSAEKIYISQDSDEVFMCSLEALSGGDARAASTSGNQVLQKFLDMLKDILFYCKDNL